MKYSSYVLMLILVFAFVSHAGEVKFHVEWQPPLNEDGTEQDIDNYVVYACDVPMPDGWGNELTGDKFVGDCPDGNLMTYEVPGDQTQFEGIYTDDSKKKKGEVHVRVTSRRAFDANGTAQYLESNPSNQVMFDYFVKPGKPKDVTVHEVKQ